MVASESNHGTARSPVVRRNGDLAAYCGKETKRVRFQSEFPEGILPLFHRYKNDDGDIGNCNGLPPPPSPYLKYVKSGQIRG